MKELITTQLIEEYQKHSNYLKEEIITGNTKGMDTAHMVTEKICIDSFIISLQSKQSEERQNIAKAFDEGTSDSGEFGNITYRDGEDYFNQTFKQEQK